MFIINEKPKSFKDLKSNVPCGFQMKFENGNTISIQFGFGNYCSKYDESKSSAKSVEVAIWNKEKEFYKFLGDNETIKGYCNAYEVADFIGLAKTINF